MVVPVLSAFVALRRTIPATLRLLLCAASLAAAPVARAGVLFDVPRAVPDRPWRITGQTNWQEGSPVARLTGAAALGSIHGEAGGMARNRRDRMGAAERYRLGEAAAGWTPWRQAPEGPPADLGVELWVTESRFRLARAGLPEFHSGESTAGADLGLARAVGPVRINAGLRWGSRWFKFRKVRLDYLNAGLGAAVAVPAGTGWIGPFGETLPALANPDHLPTPWSAGLAARFWDLDLAVFATNTYGSAAAVAAVGLRETVWGLRAAWSFGVHA